MNTSASLPSQTLAQPRFQTAIASLLTSSDRVIILVTSEFEGIFKNGGIGTYYKNLATRFTDAGWLVIVLLSSRDEDFMGQSPFPEVRHLFSLSNPEATLELTSFHRAMLASAQGNQVVEHSFSSLFYIQAIAHHFNHARIFVEFHEMLGLGYATMQARQAGLIPSNCVIGLTLHSGHEWIYKANECFVTSSAEWLEWVIEGERVSFEQADLAFHPSQFLKQEVQQYYWQTSHGILMPNYISVLPESC